MKIFAFDSLLFLYYMNVYKHVYELFPLATNMIIHKVQGFVNWFCSSIPGQIGFVDYTGFKYFPIITKWSQLIN